MRLCISRTVRRDIVTTSLRRLAVLSMAASAAIFLGHSRATAQEDGAAVFRSDTRLVVLHASVVDKGGKLVTNLPEAAFKVYENGAEQAIKIFKREDVPVSMGLLIDDSGSMRDKR